LAGGASTTGNFASVTGYDLSKIAVRFDASTGLRRRRLKRRTGPTNRGG